MIANDVLRGRFRKSFEKPEPVVPDAVNEYTIDLHWSHHCFRKGHRIMVQVQSTWFPLVDRNPQTFCDIYSAKESAFRKATHRVYRTQEMPSAVTFGEVRR